MSEVRVYGRERELKELILGFTFELFSGSVETIFGGPDMLMGNKVMVSDTSKMES